MSYNGQPARADGDIAVVGLACRFPGGANSEKALWDLLAERKSAYTKVPTGRYNVDAFHQKGATHLNNLATEGAHFLEQDVSAFDAPFFGITAEDAKAMDPAARMLLESTYEALENAGIPAESIAGSNTGCYVGCFTRDNTDLLNGDPEVAPMYAITGTGFSLFSNRISWYYDLKGPSISLDTACSSSLVGLHLACQSLRSGETNMALVCGANLMLSPSLALWLSNLNMLSPDGLSRSFADEVKGYGRGEGIATIILKPMAAALRDGDPIRAVVKGSGVNQDGHTRGITVPNSDAQADLIESTYRSAGLDFAETGYFEAHGTGTAVGDPLELAAVARCMKVAKRRVPLHIGCLKSNIGHLEGAAGLAGLIKCILMLEKGVILPNIHFDTANKQIPFEEYALRVPTEVTPWPEGCSRRASVNSFGYGGTNAHVIVEAHFASERGFTQDVPQDIDVDYDAALAPRRLFVQSGNNPSALQRIQAQYGKYAQEAKQDSNAQSTFDDLAYTLGSRRSRSDWTAYQIASDLSELEEALLRVKPTATRATKRVRVGFVFTGQGAQWALMGLGLMQYPVFRQGMYEAQQFLSDLGCPWRLMEELEKPEAESRIGTPMIAQPVCTILQTALVDLLRSWSVLPTAVVGHSSGEIAAAYCAGALTKEAAWEVAYHRGRLCSATTEQGSMIAVALGEDAVKPYLVDFAADEVNVACINSPSSITLSGHPKQVGELTKRLREDKVIVSQLKVDKAYHSPQMELLAETYLQSIAHVKAQQDLSPAGPRMISSVTGQHVAASDLTPEYWVRNLVSPVLFSAAALRLVRSPDNSSRRRNKTSAGIDFLLEIGPHAALRAPLRQILEAQGLGDVGYTSMLRRGKDDTETAMSAAGELWCRGLRLDIAAVNCFHEKPAVLKDLPPYPWDWSHKYSSTTRLTNNYLQRTHPRHSLLGVRLAGSDALHPAWRYFLNLSENPWVTDHVVHGSILFPGAGYLVMTIEAAVQIAEEGRDPANVRLRDVRITKPLVLAEDSADPEIITRFQRSRASSDSEWSGWWDFSISCATGLNEPQEHAMGQVRVEYRREEPHLTLGSEIIHQARESTYSTYIESSTNPMDKTDFYAASKAVGLAYGPHFQGVVEMARSDEACCWRIQTPDRATLAPASPESKHVIHPTTLDAIMHTFFAAMNKDNQFQSAALPVAFGMVVVSMGMPSKANTELVGFSVVEQTATREVTANIYAASPDWDSPLVRIEGLLCTELPAQQSPTSHHDAAHAQNAPIGTVLERPDIDLMTGRELRAYIEESHSAFALPPTDNPLVELFSQITQTVILAAFKCPTLSVLQIGGFHEGFTDFLLSTIAEDIQGPSLTPRMTILDLDDGIVSKIRNYQESGSLCIQAAHLRPEQPLAAQIEGGHSFDFLLLPVALTLDASVKNEILTQARSLVKPGGKMIIVDTQQSIAVNPSLYGHREKPSLTDELSVYFESPTTDEAMVISSQTADPEVEEVAENIVLLHSPVRSPRAESVVAELTKLLNSQGVKVKALEWPPNMSDLKGRFVISFVELDRPLLWCLSATDFDALRDVALRSRRLLWVTAKDDPKMNVATGWLRVLQNENPNRRYQLLRLQDRFERPALELCGVVARVAMAQTQERELFEANGYLNIPRWTYESEMTRFNIGSEDLLTFDSTVLQDITSDHSIRLHHRGQLEGAHFVLDNILPGSLSPDEVEIEVHFIMLTDADVRDPEKVFLREASGLVGAVGSAVTNFQPGDRVCICFNGRLANRVRAKEAFCHKVPNNLSLEDTASLPLTFAPSVRAVADIARVKPGQKILIQAAATKIGRAATLVAQKLDATVFATARTREEYDQLVVLGLSSSNILDDTDIDFPDAIMAMTEKRGLDAVIYSDYSKDARERLSRCISPHGVLVDAASTDALIVPTTPDLQPQSWREKDSSIGARAFRRNNREVFRMAMSRALEYASQLKKLARSLLVLPSSHIVDALNYQKTDGAHRGAVISFNERDRIPTAVSLKNNVISLDKQGTYVLAGGLGGVGRSLANLLVSLGARNLVFLSRTGPNSDAAGSVIQAMEGLNVAITVVACDVSDEASLARAISQCADTMPPIRGVIQAATVIRDAIFDKYTFEDWVDNLRPKVQGSWNLHKQLPKDVDFFVMLSSIAGLIGHQSQAGYAAGNTFQGSLAHYRRARGWPAVSIDLGPMLDVGAIVEGTTQANFATSDAVWMREAELHAIVKMCITGATNGRITPAQVCTGLPSGGMLQIEQHGSPNHYRIPLFAHLKDLDTEDVAEEASMVTLRTGASLVEQLGGARSSKEAREFVTRLLQHRLASYLGEPAENVDIREPLHRHGVDSLKAVELRTWIERTTNAEVSLFDILDAKSVQELASSIVRTSTLLPEGLAEKDH